MVKIVHLDANVFVAPQLTEADFPTLAALGIRAIVNNRPDGEAADQLSSTAAEAAARRHGMSYRFLPLTCATITDEEVVESFARVLNTLPAPILFYCRTGTRCATVWTQVAAARIGVSPALQLAARAGFDLEDLREELEEKHGMEQRPAQADSPRGLLVC